jgi:hypothetical protein
VSKTNKATFTRQPIAAPYDPSRRRPGHAAPMQVVTPQITPRQLNAQFISGAESQHDRSSRRLIEGMVIGAAAGSAWSAWRRRRA